MLDIDNIFPCPDESYKILEPHSCRHVLNINSIVTSAGSNLLVRKRLSKESLTIYYSYKDLMRWEYELIFRFFRRQRGQYNDFYVVMWDFPYNVMSVPDSTHAVLDSTYMLTASSGYIGNTMLAYNTGFDPQKSTELNPIVDKQILTIEGIVPATNTVQFSTAIEDTLQSTNTVLYILTPAIFFTNALKPTTNDICIDKSYNYYKGFGYHYQSGPIMTVEVSFVSLATFEGVL